MPPIARGHKRRLQQRRELRHRLPQLSRTPTHPDIVMWRPRSFPALLCRLCSLRLGDPSGGHFQNLVPVFREVRQDDIVEQGGWPTQVVQHSGT